MQRLVEAGDAGPWDAALVLTTEAGEARAHRLTRVLQRHMPRAELRVLPGLSDPSDHAALFAALGPALDALPRPAAIDVVLSAGTPQMQTLWVLLGLAGLLDRGGPVRLLQVIPARFVPDPHPRAWREVTLDIDGFPEVRALRAEVARLRADADGPLSGLVGESAAMATLRRRLPRVARADHLPVLVLGETGTGKERVSRAVHDLSPRSGGPFVAESCAAFSETLLMSELFGHEAGAFTGARSRRRGLFERAHGGTLMLDEVGELPTQVQSALLRVLQEGRIRRVGGEHPIDIDVRVVAATHRNLREMVEAGTFRADLYYRLRGLELQIPPLRARLDDLERLVAHFLNDSSLRVSPSAWAALRGWTWPGNVRELRAEVLRWTVFCEDTVQHADLSPEIRGCSPRQAPRTAPHATLAEQVRALEDAAITEALAATHGNLSAAARRLGIDRNTLKRKRRRLQSPVSPVSSGGS